MIDKTQPAIDQMIGGDEIAAIAPSAIALAEARREAYLHIAELCRSQQFKGAHDRPPGDPGIDEWQRACEQIAMSCDQLGVGTAGPGPNELENVVLRERLEQMETRIAAVNNWFARCPLKVGAVERTHKGSPA